MSKFHINKHGVPAPCRATKGNCPYGGSDGAENHFNTEEEAQVYANKIFEGAYSFLPGMKESSSVPEERRVNLYHATSSQVLQKIMDEGMFAPPSDSGLSSNGLGFDASSEDDGIYLADTDDHLSIYIDGAIDNGTFNKNLPNCGVIIELYADSDNLIADKDDYKGENADAATWQDSLEDCNQVVHKGGIQANQIKSITFKGPLKMGSYFGSKKRPVMEMVAIRKKLINGRKLSLQEAGELLKDVDREVEEKYS